jgi:hypothetical protein
VVVTVQLTNTAPAFGLPIYVTSGLNYLPPGSKPGDDRLLMDYYATGGALLNSVSVNGDPATASVHTIDGLAVFRMDLVLPRGTTTTIVLHLIEPAGTGQPEIWHQPGVTPMDTRVFNGPCL